MLGEVNRHAIDTLLLRLSDTGPADPELETYVLARLKHSPGTSYALVRTLLMTEMALAAAEARLAEFERGNPDEVPASGAGRSIGGGFGSTILELLRFDGSTTAGRRRYDPDDVDALGFDEEPDRR